MKLIQRVKTYEQRTVFMGVCIIAILFLFSVVTLVSFLIATSEKELLEKRSQIPVRIGTEILTIANYRCSSEGFHQVLIHPRSNQITFLCEDGKGFKDTVEITTLPRSHDEDKVDYAMD